VSLCGTHAVGVRGGDVWYEPVAADGDEQPVADTHRAELAQDGEGRSAASKEEDVEEEVGVDRLRLLGVVSGALWTRTMVVRQVCWSVSLLVFQQGG
jgi:hypothetical protein